VELFESDKKGIDTMHRKVMSAAIMAITFVPLLPAQDPGKMFLDAYRLAQQQKQRQQQLDLEKRRLDLEEQRLSPSSPGPDSIDNQVIITMAKDFQWPESTILAAIRQNTPNFTFSGNDLKALQDAGVTPTVLQAMRERAGAAVPEQKTVGATSTRVAVIAPSVSTGMLARQVLQTLHATETSFRGAVAVLVVVRSGLYYPLNPSYESVAALKRDADGQLNITGANYHVYMFSVSDDLILHQLAHQSFEARD
jgi:hypothetical protein